MDYIVSILKEKLIISQERLDKLKEDQVIAIQILDLQEKRVEDIKKAIDIWENKVIDDEPQYFIRARAHEILKKDDVVKVCGYEDDYLLVEKVSDEVLVVDSERPDDDNNLLIRIYGKNEFKENKVLPESLWDYDRSLCHSRKTIGLRVKNVKDNKVYFYDDMAYEAYGIEYFDGKTFKPHVKK